MQNIGAYPYDVRLPEPMEPDKRYPAVFVLHGKGSNEQPMLDLLEPVGDDFIVIGIRGDLPLGPGFQYYELKSLGHPLRDSFDRAVRQLQEFILQACSLYPIDPVRRYVLGFSQGSILSMTLALTMGDQLKGIAALNGYIPDFVKNEYPLRSLQEVSVFISHGQFDSVFPIRIGQETAAYLKERTPHLTFHTYPSDHGITSANQQDVIRWLYQDAGITDHQGGEQR